MTLALVTSLSVGPEHLPGCDLDHVRKLVTGELVDERPIEVVDVGCGHLMITNGRHRYLAALVRGDTHVPVAVLSTR